MSGFHVMAAFAAGATIAGMAVGAARLTDIVEPATAVADVEAGKPAPVANTTGSPEAGHPEPFDSAASGRYAQDRLRDAAMAAERSRRAATSTPTSTTSTSEPQPQKKPPPGWRAPEGTPEEVNAGVLARVASRRAKAASCEPAREVTAVERKERTGRRREEKPERCPPEDGIESVEIDWSHGSPPTR